MALNEYDKLNSDEQVRDTYLRRVTYARDNRARMADAWEGGKAEGRSEGKAERSVEIAKAMLYKGMDLNTISDVTGLSIADIKKDAQ